MTVVSVVDDVIKWARVTGDVTVPHADLDHRDPDRIRGGVIEFVEFEPARNVESEGAQWDSPSRSPDPPAR